jgi:predicted Zn-dependent protease with MMP-like domain
MIDPIDQLIEQTVVETLDELPEVFRAQLGTVAIVVEDEPTAAQLGSVGARGLFGLYQGVPRTVWGASNAAVPSKITLFRGPLARVHRTPERLAAGVRDTLHHEIAHHFGISDARLTELQRRGRRSSGVGPIARSRTAGGER